MVGFYTPAQNQFDQQIKNMNVETKEDFLRWLSTINTLSEIKEEVKLTQLVDAIKKVNLPKYLFQSSS